MREAVRSRSSSAFPAGRSSCPACSLAREVNVRDVPGSLTVPPAALVRDGSRSRRRRRPSSSSNNKAERRDVTVGVEVPDAVQVTSGLKAGEVVVVDPPSALGPGHAGSGRARHQSGVISHVSERSLHQAAGLRHHDDGGAGGARPHVVPGAEGRSLSRRRVPGRHGHDAVYRARRPRPSSAT